MASPSSGYPLPAEEGTENLDGPQHGESMKMLPISFLQPNFLWYILYTFDGKAQFKPMMTIGDQW